MTAEAQALMCFVTRKAGAGGRRMKLLFYASHITKAKCNAFYTRILIPRKGSSHRPNTYQLW